MSVSAKITEQEEAAIYRLVERGCFLNKSDFTRTAIRELLASFPSVGVDCSVHHQAMVDSGYGTCSICGQRISTVEATGRTEEAER